MSAPLMSVEIVRPEDVSQRNHRKFSNDSLRAAAVHHKLVFAQRHYQRNQDTASGGAYGYLPRTKPHMIRKARKFGHQDPWVFSGRERAHVLANSRVTATFRKSRVIYRSLHSRSGDARQQWEGEMGAISPAEARKATDIAAETYHKRFEEHRATKRVRERNSLGQFI